MARIKPGSLREAKSFMTIYVGDKFVGEVKPGETLMILAIETLTGPAFGRTEPGFLVLTLSGPTWFSKWWILEKTKPV